MRREDSNWCGFSHIDCIQLASWDVISMENSFTSWFTQKDTRQNIIIIKTAVGDCKSMLPTFYVRKSNQFWKIYFGMNTRLLQNARRMRPNSVLKITKRRSFIQIKRLESHEFQEINVGF